MAKIIIDIDRTHRTNTPINIEVIQVGFGFEMKEILLYALKAVFDEEREVMRGTKKNVQQKNNGYR